MMPHADHGRGFSPHHVATPIDEFHQMPRAGRTALSGPALRVVVAHLFDLQPLVAKQQLRLA
jgi:hypothetical protein